MSRTLALSALAAVTLSVGAALAAPFSFDSTQQGTRQILGPSQPLPEEQPP
jgi:hypothetical protein